MVASQHKEEAVYPFVLARIIRIDNQGSVWRGRRRAENDTGKYLQVRIMRNGVRHHALAHRLVWLHFWGAIPGNLQINHINGDGKDNRPGEFGADNRVDEYSTRCKDIRQGEDRESTRRGEPRKQTIQITGERNTTPTISGRETCNDCGGLRGEISNDLKNRSQRTLDWCVVGGESGAGRRLMDYDWARLIRDQCVASDTAFYYKQGNNFKPGMDNFLNGRTWEQHPGDVEVVNITSAPAADRMIRECHSRMSRSTQVTVSAHWHAALGPGETPGGLRESNYLYAPPCSFFPNLACPLNV